jgi:uncharacterized membrane protein
VISTRQDRRRGAVLVQFAVLVAVLLGIAALASDLGLIRATQASMQNAADAGALEGARWTDAIDDNPRRQLAKDAIKRTYDLDAKVNVEGGADEYFTEATGLGAGPVVQVFATGGVHGAGGHRPIQAEPATELAERATRRPRRRRVRRRLRRLARIRRLLAHRLRTGRRE